MYGYYIARWAPLVYFVLALLMLVSCFFSVPMSLTSFEMFLLMGVYLVGYVAVYHWVDTQCYRMWLSAPEHRNDRQKHLSLYDRVRTQIDSLGWAIMIINSCIVAGVICQISIGVGNVVLIAGVVCFAGCWYVARCVVHHKEKWFRM